MKDFLNKIGAYYAVYLGKITVEKHKLYAVEIRFWTEELAKKYARSIAALVKLDKLSQHDEKHVLKAMFVYKDDALEFWNKIRR